jgi:GNAT superfamily N-acetyltransferase
VSSTANQACERLQRAKPAKVTTKAVRAVRFDQLASLVPVGGWFRATTTVCAVTTVANSEEYEFDDNPSRVDPDVVWHFLSEQAYWGKWRTKDVVQRQIDASWRVVGVYDKHTKAMVGFARAISDGVSLAYVADVFVLPDHRSKGLGVGLMNALIEQGPGAHFRWMLHTGDAHELYAKFGFASPDNTYLERRGRSPKAG